MIEIHSKMKFSVVIPNLNSNVIHQTLAALHGQIYPKSDFEVIVVGLDQLGLVLEDELVRFVRTDRPFTPAEARNLGAEIAKGEIIAFIDSDCIPSRHWLSRIAEKFTEDDLVAVGGGVKFDDKEYWKFADNLSMFYEFLCTLPSNYRRQIPSLNFAIKANIFHQFNGFDTAYTTAAGEDFDLTNRMSESGMKMWFEASASVFHNPPRNSLTDLWRHAYNIGRNSTKLDQRFSQDRKLPNWLRRKYFLLFASPLMAFYVTLRVVSNAPFTLKHLLAVPAVFLSKIAWCFGAANSPRLTR